MVHPNGGDDYFAPKNSFKKAYKHVGQNGIEFRMHSGDEVGVYRGQARDGVTKTIVFRGDSSRFGSVCEQCWGYRVDCNRTQVAPYAEALDSELEKYPG